MWSPRRKEEVSFISSMESLNVGVDVVDVDVDVDVDVVETTFSGLFDS